MYFFPTKSSEFVISVPLSVMEALSCGTPVVAYSSFEKLSLIKTNNENAMELITNVDELSDAIDKAKANKSCKTYLADSKNWNEVSECVLKSLQKI